MVARVLSLLTSMLVTTAPLPALAHEAQLWFNTTLFGSVGDLAYYAEAQPRFGDDISKLDQFFYRPALGWKVNENLKIYQGYGYVEDRGGSTVRIEDRSFQEINWTIGELNGVKTSSRTRFEQRWRSDGKDVGFRFRNQLRVATALTDRKDSVAALGWTEVFVGLNTVDWGPRVGFDQVRTFAGLEIPIGGKSTVELGYLSRLIQTRTALETDHILSINLFIRP